MSAVFADADGNPNKDLAPPESDHMVKIGRPICDARLH